MPGRVWRPGEPPGHSRDMAERLCDEAAYPSTSTATIWCHRQCGVPLPQCGLAVGELSAPTKLNAYVVRDGARGPGHSSSVTATRVSVDVGR